MAPPTGSSRLIDDKPASSYTDNQIHPPNEYRKPVSRTSRPVDFNVMKKNMSIAKGFMDISLLTANANQLGHLTRLGDSEDPKYYVLLVGLILSLIIQVSVGVMLIVKERFDLNLEEDHKSADLYNNITVVMVFVTLILNVFISSFGISIMEREMKVMHVVTTEVGGLNMLDGSNTDFTTPVPT